MGIQPWNHAPAGYQTVADVIAKQNAVLNFMTGGIKSYYGQEQAEKKLEDKIKADLLQRLQALEKAQLKKEKEAYAKLGVGSWSELEAKAKKWAGSGAKNILKDFKLQNELQTALNLKVEEDFAEALDYIVKYGKFSFNTSQLVAIFGPELEDFVKVCLSIIKHGTLGGAANRSGFSYLEFEGSLKGGPSHGKVTVLSGGKTRITKGVTLLQKTKKKKSDKDTVELRFTSDMPRSSKLLVINKVNKLINQYNQSLPKNQQIKKIGSLDSLNAVFRKYTTNSIKDPRAKSILNAIFNQYVTKKGDIAINRSSGAIKGALGEVYWNAFFRYFNIPNAIPAGVSFKQKGTGAEVPIDIALEAIGFQVKNYQEKDGVIVPKGHFKKEGEQIIIKPDSVKLRTFVNGGLQWDANSLGEFLFSRSYNRRNIKYDPKGNYSTIENRGDLIFSQIINFFKMNKAQILSLDKTVELINDISANANLDVGKPVFFMINEHIIPSSKMIEDIMVSIVSGADAKIKVENFNCDLASGFSSNGAIWPNGAGINFSGLNSEIHYTITINLKAFLQIL